MILRKQPLFIDLGTKSRLLAYSVRYVALASFLQFNPPQHQDSNVNTTRYDLCSQVAEEGDAFQFCEATFKAINEEVKRNSFNSPVLLSSEQLRDFVYRLTKSIAGNFYNIFRHSGEIRNLVVMDLRWGNHVVFNNFDGFVSKRNRALKTLDKFYAEDLFDKFINTLDGFDISWTSYLATCNVEYCLETAPKKPMAKTVEIIAWSGGWAAFIIIPCLLFIIPCHLYMDKNSAAYSPRPVPHRERGPAAAAIHEVERIPPAGCL
jgi:hypothetical protein